MMRFTIAATGALLFAACNRGGTEVPIPDLDRSGKIQLICVDVDFPTSFEADVRGLLPREVCSLDTSEFAPGFQPSIIGEVTQVQDGVVSAINFAQAGVFDTNVAVPGFTALRVGEQPTGIQVSPENSDFTYVSSFSAKSIQAIATESILGVQDQLEPAPFVLDAGPSDLALYEIPFLPPQIGMNEDGLVALDTVTPAVIAFRWLFAPIPDLGAIAQVRWDVGKNAFMETSAPLILLPTVPCVADPPPPPDPPPSTDMDYNRICPNTGPDARFVKTVQSTNVCTDGNGQGPRPIAVHVDDGGTPGDPTDDLLLVADANQPVIHRFSLSAAGATSLDMIRTNTPTLAITTTPPVPAAVENQDATQRYLYAITAPDSSVLAMNYTPSSGEDVVVLPVLAGVTPRANEEGVESRNRVRSVFSNARAIEVVSPEYELNNGVPPVVPAASLCNPLDSDEVVIAQSPSNMRGVFLAISLANGVMFFLDIYDLNATCRGSGCNTVTEPDAFASIRRHRRRWSITPSTATIDIQGTPALLFDASQGTLDPDTGVAQNSDGPGLEFIQCPSSMDSVFGTDPQGIEDGLICTSTQVWSNETQAWDATYEGLIPNSEGGLGFFASESIEGRVPSDGGAAWLQAGDVPFCQVGVLGSTINGVPTELPGPNPAGIPSELYAGDRALITSIPPPETRDLPQCQIFADVPDDIDTFPIWFPIVRAFDNELEIGPSPSPLYSLEQVEECYTQFTEYQINTRGVYTVVGSLSGFVHRTTTNIFNGECMLDAERPITCLPPDETCDMEMVDVDTVLSGRAFPDVQFINPFASFQIGPFEDVAVTDSTFAMLTFSIFNGFSVLFIDTGAGGFSSLPSSLEFVPEFDQLFFVDLQNGVNQLGFEPLSTLQIFR